MTEDENFTECLQCNHFQEAMPYGLAFLDPSQAHSQYPRNQQVSEHLKSMLKRKKDKIYYTKGRCGTSMSSI